MFGSRDGSCQGQRSYLADRLPLPHGPPAGDASAFAEQVRPLQEAAPATARFVFATATLPEEQYMSLEEEFPGLVAALGPGLHRTAPGEAALGVCVWGGPSA